MAAIAVEALDFNGQAHMPESASLDADSLLHANAIVFKNGLVDPRSVFEYMQRCHCADLGRVPGAHHAEFHHLIFPLKKYKTVRIPLAKRQARNAYSNQVEILNCQEDHYHQDSEAEVDDRLINEEAARTFVEEDIALWSYASSSFMVAEMTEQLESLPLLRAERARVAARLALMKDIQNQDETRIGQIEIMDDAVVTGALRLYLRQKRETGLQKLVDTRLATADAVIPTRIYGEGTLSVRP